jgi:hypothetical protein
VAALVVYHANGREAYPTGDSRPTALLPLSLLYEGDLDLNEYHPPDAAVGGPIRLEDGRVLSNYSPVPALLSLPVYLLAWPHRGEVNGDILRWAPFFSKLAGSVLAALALAVFLLAALEVASPRAAALTALAYAFASPFWVSAGQTLGQHGVTALCWSAALLALLRLERGGASAWAAAAGLAAAVAAGTRLPNAVVLAALVAWLLARRRVGHAALFAAPAVIVGLPLAVHLLAMAGGAGGGLEAFAFLGRVRDAFGHPIPGGLAGLLVSPGEGLLLWSPAVTLLLLPAATALRGGAGGVRGAGAGESARRRPPRGAPRADAPWALPVLRASAACGVLLLIVYAGYVAWWGGRTYGPRYATDALPFLLLPAAAGLERWLGARTFRGLFTAAVVAGAAIQALGAFRYPCRGPTGGGVRPDEERIWDWGGTDVELCAGSPRRPAQDVETAGRLVRITWGRLTGP